MQLAPKDAVQEKAAVQEKDAVQENPRKLLPSRTEPSKSLNPRSLQGALASWISPLCVSFDLSCGVEIE
jgi:hypothetical protein